MTGNCLPPLVDMSNGVPLADDGDPVVPGCWIGGPVTAVDPVPGVVACGNVDVAAGGIVNEMPRSATIGCHGLRADRLSSLPVIRALRSDL